MAALQFNYVCPAAKKNKEIMQHCVVPGKGILFLFLTIKSPYD